MIRFKFFLLLPLAFCCVFAQPATATDATIDAPSLTADNLNDWKSHILPSPADLAWTQIPWLPDLQSGIEAAAQVDKPLLLWTMNGHPLGCT